MKYIPFLLPRAGALSLSLLPLPCLLAAQPAVYEPFAYTSPTAPILMEGGRGFSGSWAGAGGLIPADGGFVPNGGMEVLPESLSYSDGVRILQTSGGSLEVTGQNGNVKMARALDLEEIPHPGGDPKTGRITYVSFLAQRAGEPADPGDPVYNGDYPYGGNLYPRSAGIGFHSWNDEEVLQLSFGNLSNMDTDVWRFTGEDLYGDERRDARSDVPFGEGNETRLLVVRIDHGGGGWQGDRISVWIDPVLASEAANGFPITFDWTTRDEPLYVQPAYISVAANNASSLRPFSVLRFDEFRMGDSWESVTPHTGGELWGNRAVLEDGSVPTGDRFLGRLEPDSSGWVHSSALDSWAYIPENLVGPRGAWVFLNPTGKSIPALTALRPELNAYEGFDYATSNESPLHLVNDGLEGGVGWGGPWTFPDRDAPLSRAFVLEDSITYRDQAGYQLVTSGGHAWISGVPEGGATNPINTRVQRALAQPPETVPGQPVYLSFLGQRVGQEVDLEDPLWSDTEVYPEGYPWGDNLYPRGAGLSLLESAQSGDESAHIGNRSDQRENLWTLSAESTDMLANVPFTEPSLVVVRLDYFQGLHSNLRGEISAWTGTRATLWMNPVSLLREEDNAFLRQVVHRDLVDPYTILVEGIALHAGDDSYNRPHAEIRVDEIRVGNAWDAVTPVAGGKPDLPRQEELTWGGLRVYDQSLVWAGSELGWLRLTEAPWLYSHRLQTWLYCREEWVGSGPLWCFVVDSSR